MSGIHKMAGPFGVLDLQEECYGVGVDLIRLVLKRLRSSGQVICLGRGQNAKWEKTQTFRTGNT